MTTDLQVSREAEQLSAMSQMPKDMVLLKLENDQIFAVARAQPRDPMKIVAQLQALIDAYPAAADDAIYSKPVGTVMRIRCKCGIQYEAPIKWVNRKPVAEPEPCPDCGEWAPVGQESVKKFAEGLSIRAAESIRSIYGYTRLATTTEVLDDGKVKLSGVLVDYAAGNVTSDERIVSPYYKSRGGQMQRTPEDRFLNVIVKAEKAKLRRDVILDNTPNIVKAMFRDACEQKLLGLVAPEVIEQKVLPAFAVFGVTADHLDKIVGRPRALGWRESERLDLRKILSALKNGETSAAELLAGLEPPDAAPAGETTPPSGATMEDLAGPAAEDQQEEDSAGGPGDDDSVFRRYVAALGEAKTSEAVAELLTDAEGDNNVTATDLSKLRTIGANMRIRLNRERTASNRKEK